MVVWGEKSDGTDDVVVFTGTARWDGRHLTLARHESDFQLLDEWLDRLRPVRADLKATLLDSEYFLNVTIGNLPDGTDTRSYFDTGLKWPSTPNESSRDAD